MHWPFAVNLHRRRWRCCYTPQISRDRPLSRLIEEPGENRCRQDGQAGLEVNRAVGHSRPPPKWVTTRAVAGRGGVDVPGLAANR
jgi:hypothetical protein